MPAMGMSEKRIEEYTEKVRGHYRRLVEFWSLSAYDSSSAGRGRRRRKWLWTRLRRKRASPSPRTRTRSQDRAGRSQTCEASRDRFAAELCANRAQATSSAEWSAPGSCAPARRQVVCQLERGVSEGHPAHRWLSIARRVLEQKKDDTHKIYFLHEPHVYCLAKGKEHKKYAFGAKASLVVGMNGGVIVGAYSLPENDYDAHTVEPSLQQVEHLNGYRPQVAIAADRDGATPLWSSPAFQRRATPSTSCLPLPLPT